MRHTRQDVIDRTEREFEALDALLAGFAPADWARLLLRPETQDPWRVKDAIAHVTHWKADTARRARKGPRPVEERGLATAQGNHLIYVRWRDRTPQAVLAGIARSRPTSWPRSGRRPRPGSTAASTVRIGRMT